MDADWDRNNLLALLQKEKPDWDRIVQRVTSTWEEAFLTDPLTKMNAVHYIILRRRTCPSMDVIISTVRSILAQNAEAAVACDVEHGFTPLAFVCDTAPQIYVNIDLTKEQVEEILEQDAALITALHEENDIAMDISSKRGLPPLAIHVAALSRCMRQRKLLRKGSKNDGSNDEEDEDEEDDAVDMSTSPLLEALTQRSSLEDCSRALNTLFLCNTSAVMKHYMQEEERARNGEMSEGLENGWWLLDLLVQVLFAAHNQLYRGQTITNFSPLHTLTAIQDCPIPFVMIAVRASVEDLRKPEKVFGNLPAHNVANWELPYGDPVTRKSIALSTLLRMFPDAETVRNKDGETVSDIYYRKTNTLSADE
ncbi:hypothetical protein ACA910_014934 [Epithemia clementina (nom. ined.)]